MEFHDILQVKLHNGQLNMCLSDWAYVLGAMHKLPLDSIFESPIDAQIDRSQSLRDIA